MLDIFDNDAFSVHALTAAIDKLPFAPGRLGELGVFRSVPVTTPMAVIEERLGTLSLLMSKLRGTTEQNTQSGNRRRVRAFPIPHVPHWDALLASDLDGKRAFGSEDQLDTFSQILNDRLENMKQDHEMTHEWHRMGALKGVVYDGDGTTSLYNWYTEFGITESIVYFNSYNGGTYDNSNPTADFKKVSLQVIRHIRDALGGTPFKGVHALCGDTFFDALISHPTVRRAYERYRDGEVLRSSQIGEGEIFPFAGIDWENYRGTFGSAEFVPATEARFFPTGTKDVFLEVIAPADFIETVNTRGMKVYAKQERMKFDKGIELHTQSNVLYMCTRPSALVRGMLITTQLGSGS